MSFLHKTIDKLQRHLDVKKIVLVSNAVPNDNCYFGEVPPYVGEQIPLDTLLNSDTVIEKLFVSEVPIVLALEKSAEVSISMLYVLPSVRSSFQEIVKAGLSGKEKFKNTVLIPGDCNVKAGSGDVRFNVSSFSQAVKTNARERKRKLIFFINVFILNFFYRL